jgi:hypothetical protein
MLFEDMNEMVADGKSGDHALASAVGKADGDKMRFCFASYRHPVYQLFQALLYLGASREHEFAGEGPLPDLVRNAEDDVHALSSYSIPDPWQRGYRDAMAMIAKQDIPASQNVTATEKPVSNPYAVAEATLFNDAFFSNCQIHHVPGNADATAQDVLTEFTCVFRARDYRAAEVLGESLTRTGVKLDQQDLYWLSYSYYKRGNNEKALQYARQAYSRVSAKDKARCQSNVSRCADLRQLLASIEPSYHARFAAEDSSIRAVQQQAAAATAEAAQEAAAIAFVDSGSGIHSTEVFHVNGSWELQWSYDCSGFSSDGGNFAVMIDGDVQDVLVNQLGTGDSGTEYVHEGGNVYLKINSECDWTVKAVND